MRIEQIARAIQPIPRNAIKLGVLAIAAVIVSLAVGCVVGSTGKPLRTPLAPRGGVSLQLASTAAEASAIRNEWKLHESNGQPLTDVFKESLQQDFYLIAAYVLGLGLTALWAGWVINLSRVALRILVGLIIVAGLCDLVENLLLGFTFGFHRELPFNWISGPLLWVVDGVLNLFVAVRGWFTGATPRMLTSEYLRVRDFEHAVTLARLAAMTKFSLLLLATGGIVAAAGGAIRLLFDLTTGLNRDVIIQSFKDLVDLETKGIFANSPRRTMDTPECSINAPADEQFVQFRAADVIGLALSGGGIRSATFNLGLLQGLQRIGLLRLFDYLATVSGGGYVGAFWSEWLARKKDRGDEAEDNLFPTRTDASLRPNSLIDTNQERHLREFSSFLAPRIGFFEVEMWTAVVALLAGLIPALLIGLSVIGAGIIGWLSLTFALASKSPWAPASIAALITFLVFRAFERLWQEFKSESAGKARVETAAERALTDRAAKRYWVVAVAAIVLVLFFQLKLPGLYESKFGGPWPIFTQYAQGAWSQAPSGSGIVRWWAVTGIANVEHPWIFPQRPWIFSPRLFDFALVWFGVGFVLVLWRVRHAVYPWRTESLAAFDRVLMRVLALGAFWATLAVIWHVAINVSSVIGAATGALFSGGAFAALRNWIGVALRRPSESSMTDRLKPYLPQVLAYLTIALSGVAVGGLLIRWAGADWFQWWTAAATMSIFLVLALFIKTDEFGLHAFYRDRINRAYAGACNLEDNQNASDNRGTDPRDGDDRKMSRLVDHPLHLVCCAANDLSGDQVETLSRGARSAVLSKHGFSLGRYFHKWTDRSDQRLGSAITASAAAFNSNMGQISVRVGPAVSFLMTMLNLRLGLWLRHPAARLASSRRWPGILLYREMFAFTSASGRISETEGPSTYLRDVHLSDGAHFENLALYELVRRHCRYVLVSDCGADPTVAFDDLGNALRRIREDFGVDIELDVSSLRPGVNSCSAQHVAVGTIHYSQTDRGILLYVKPSITGDEPTDVQQYMTRNKAFPHETTGDQFYDEAQWESYRRLGLHAADCIFDFVKREDSNKRDADWVFAEASHRWGPTPKGLEQSVVEMTKRFGALEAELHQRAASGIVKEIFPELAHLPADLKAAYEAPPPADGQARRTDTPSGDSTSLSDVTFLMRVIQLMEDAWLTCQLDQWWTHPLNLGWINLFARWATSPLFRFWWPLLSPMFSPGFRRFIDERFPMRARIAANGQPVPSPPEGRITPLGQPPTGLAVTWWAERSAQRFNRNRTFYQNVLELPHPRDQRTTVPLQVGLIGVTGHGTTVGWTSEDFFVPPSLWGAGLGWYFLKNILKLLSRHAEWCYVIVKMPPEGSRHQVALDDRHAFLEQYRKIGFREQRGQTVETAALDQALCDELGFEPEKGDTLLSLDLKQWRQRQEKPAGDDAQTERR
jgi:hypothetical protein